jgi:hypothetical protein
LSNLTIEAASEDQIQAVAGGVSALLRERHRLQPVRPTTSRSGRSRR